MTIKEIKADQTWPLRQKVMYPDAAIESVILEKDAYGKHFGLFRDEKPISVVSLFIDDNTAQFRKFCTDQAYQNQGFGKQMMRFLIEYCHQENVHLLWCNARISAKNFYEQFGFEIKENAENQAGYLKMELHNV